MSSSMQQASLAGATLEYEVRGEGDPVLLIHGSHIAASFLPLAAVPTLADHYRLIRYHRRGFAGSTRFDGAPYSIEQQAADAAGIVAWGYGADGRAGA